MNIKLHIVEKKSEKVKNIKIILKVLNRAKIEIGLKCI